MENIYPVLRILCVLFLLPVIAKSQDCTSLAATCTTYESRCAATGSLKITATGGSGNYRYKTIGPVNSNFTTSDSITGLSAGSYTVIINDIVSNCTLTKTNVVVAGTYQDPRFTLTKIDVSCDNSNNGSITVTDPLYGRPPFSYSIVAPSPMGIGSINSSGVFTNLTAGDYSIQMRDSCGGIQTRQITVVNYTWWIDSYAFHKTDCITATGFIKVIDSRGNISTVNGIPGFTYGIVRAPGDTTWSAVPDFSFPVTAQANFDVVVKDQCGIIKKAPAMLNMLPAIGSSVSSYNKLCNTFSVKLTGINNFINGLYCLYNSSDAIMACNATGTFANIPYGSYCIKGTDDCTDTVITRCFTVAPPPLSVGSTVGITNKNCTTFTASITSAVGLTNPDHCLYNAANMLVSCNASGVFPNLAYGSYCVKTTDGCRDTTITRCFTVNPPTPVIHPVNPAYITCTTFGVIITGDTLSTPTFCLYDSNDVLITCNSTGIFDSIAFGEHCITIYDPCYDTTITRCFTVTGPLIVNDVITTVSYKACTSFTVTAGSSLVNPTYCLYTDAGILTGCNTTGIFNDIPYGAYCLKTRNSCPDTTFTKCFTVNPDVPSVGATVATSNAGCATFSAAITGQTNLSSPQYCIYDTANVLLSCNTNGQFDNLPYGRYCIKITNSCYDTTITRCFALGPLPAMLSASANKSCVYGFAKITLNTGNLYLPVNVKIYRPDGSLFAASNYNQNPVLIDSIPDIPAGETYKIVATDNCGNKDSVNIGAVASYFNHTAAVSARCPGGAWANGSGNISLSISTNMGDPTVTIIKKDGVSYPSPLIPTSATANIYNFIDLGPGIYILRSSEYYCNNYMYDTVTIRTYQYPNLSRSSAYQCDANGFSVGAVASNGVGPFSYEIIGSTPSTPTIIAGPQVSPIFTINNGTDYSLIRLRAVDACGNATLGDASILPLSNNAVSADYNCFLMPVTLTVDSIYNATYTWWKKTSPGANDSTFIGTGPALHISTLTPNEAGIYICHISVNDGCIKRAYAYNLDGSCYTVLPTILETFDGRINGDKNVLYWKTAQEGMLSAFIIERKNTAGFIETGSVTTTGNTTNARQYTFTDHTPGDGNNQYRLKLLQTDHSFTYSEIITLGKHTRAAFAVYPNPVTDKLTITFGANRNHRYVVRLLNAVKQVITESTFTTSDGNTLVMRRPAAAGNGVYLLQVIDTETNQVFTEKVILQ
jgi:hypothetical protein